MSNGSFNYSVIRITIMQILRGIGFDRCSPVILDILADIYIRHLQLLTSECQSLAGSSGREGIEIQDISQALQNIGMIKPINLLDIYEQYDTKNKGAENFLYWVVGNTPENARLVSKPTAELLNQNKIKSNPVIPEYVNALNSSATGDNTADNETTQQNNDILDEDWLKYLMKKSGRLGHEERFKNTILNSGPGNSSSDHTISGPTPEILEDRLPYNLEKAEDIYINSLAIKEPIGELDHSGFTHNGYDTSTY